MKTAKYVTPEVAARLSNWSEIALMSGISFWFAPSKAGTSKLRIRKDGQLWIARSRAEWAEDCGLSERQVERALASLRQKGLIITRQGLWAGKAILHVSLSAISSSSPPKTVDSGAPKTVDSIYRSNKQKKHTSILATGVAELECKDKLQEVAETMPIKFNKPSTPKKEEAPALSVSDIAAKLKAGGPVRLNHIKPDSWQELEYLWKVLVPKLYSDCGFINFTMKDKGQFKMVYQTIEKSPHHPRDVVEHCLRNWSDFGWSVKMDTGLKDYPPKPNIGFLLKYVASAVNLFAGKKKPTGKAAKALKPETPSTHTPEVAKAVPEAPVLAKPMSKEETLDLMKDVI